MEEYSSKIGVTILTSTYEEAAKWINENIQGVNVYTFIGNTIGNFTKKELHEFFSNISKYMKNGEYFLLGMDLVKDPRVI